ncbi:MAG: hypothetical protein KDK37_00480 [Leptospiraceae bacterium]|nr:hypothetical protein [Leptospiraceae bacterium]MCB1302718.1 hypothetical protein [Leptospiraceae bacterium]
MTPDEGENETEQSIAETEQRLYMDVIESMVLGWSVFVETGIESNIDKEALASMGPAKAARVALFRLYLEGFTEEERNILLEDPDTFLRYAFGVVRELYPPHPKNKATIHHNRVAFMNSIRRFLLQERAVSRSRYREACNILKAASKMSRSVEEIARARDLYREFQFRVAAQKNLDPLRPWNALELEAPETH